MSQKEKYRKLR